MRILFSLFFIFFTTSSFAVTFNGKFIQGSFILGKTDPGSEVFIDKKKVKVTPDGYFVFGLGRDRKNDIVITINKKKIIKKVFKRKYKIQRIDGLDEKKVTPPEEVYERIKRENKLIGEARTINSSSFSYPFIFSFNSFINFFGWSHFFFFKTIYSLNFIFSFKNLFYNFFFINCYYNIVFSIST